MNSFVDAHTPSESPEASSSESSSAGDWESGEFKTNELCVEHWPKQQRTFSNSKTKTKKQFVANIKSNNNIINNKSNMATNTATITTSTSSILPPKLSHQNQFKAKSNSIKIFGNTSNLSRSNNVTSVVTNININNNVHLSKLNSKKMRWLWNMRTDPEFNETLVKTVNIQTPPSELVVASGVSSSGGGDGGAGRKSSDSLSDMDYYSTICDNQLSVGSPYKSPSDYVPALLNDQMKLRSRTNSFTKRQQKQQQQQHSLMMHHTKHTHASSSSSPTQPQISSGERTSSNGASGDPILVVAKPIESQSIGFNVIDTCTVDEKQAAAAAADDSDDHTKKRCEKETTHFDPFVDNLPKRPKSNDFDEMIPVSASSSSSLFSIANEQNSIFDFSFSPKMSTCSTGTGGTSSSNCSAMNSKMSIACDSTDTSASNSPTDEIPSKYTLLPLHKMAHKTDTSTKNKAPLPPLRSAADFDEIDGCAGGGGGGVSKITVSPLWLSDTNVVQQSNADHTAKCSTSSTSSSSSTSLSNVKRGRPPFSFREFRNELRSVMRQNRNISK